MFEWADKGSWRCRTSEEEDFDGRKFRIGFEPLFVDFTKEGAVYIIFLLFKWFALGIVAGTCATAAPPCVVVFRVRGTCHEDTLSSNRRVEVSCSFVGV